MEPIDTGPVMGLLGEMVWLYSHSKLHRDWPIGAIHQWLVPAIFFGQVRVFRKQGKPVGFVTWAWMSEAVETAYVRNTATLQQQGWKSGNRGWIVDLCCPFGGAREIVNDLRGGLFRNQVGRFLRQKDGSDTLKIFYVHGVDALDKARDRSLNPTVVINPGSR